MSAQFLIELHGQPECHGWTPSSDLESEFGRFKQFLPVAGTPCCARATVTVGHVCHCHWQWVRATGPPRGGITSDRLSERLSLPSPVRLRVGPGRSQAACPRPLIGPDGPGRKRPLEGDRKILLI